jgi:hypothetical protein
MTALILGVISMLLFFLPVLGIPIGICGLFFGTLAVPIALFYDLSLRWSVAGIATCSLALAINLAVTYAPSGYVPPPSPPKVWQTAPGRQYIPPPAQE